MSFGEIIVVAIIAILVCKPEDIKFIIKEFYKFKTYILELSQEISKPFVDELEQLNPEVVEEINLYLEKITSLNKSYQGEYSLKAIKKYYYQLIKNKHE